MVRGEGRKANSNGSVTGETVRPCLKTALKYKFLACITAAAAAVARDGDWQVFFQTAFCVDFIISLCSYDPY